MLSDLKDMLVSNKEKIIDILKEIETEKVAIEEYRLSINALNNSKKYNNIKVNCISTFLPMNLPLFSIIIYVVIPKNCASKLYYRPSLKVLKQVQKIHKLLFLDNYDIELFDGSRFDFQRKIVNKSNVVVFIGKSENADEVSKQLSNDVMFIYFGIGQNPVIISENADLKKASIKIAKTVMFNYGQDCAKPNIILCKKSLYKEFLEKLVIEIKNNFDQKTTIKDLNSLIKVANLLSNNIDCIEYGGKIDFKNKTMDPVVIVKNYEDVKDNYDEYYAPVFKIMLYNDISDLKKYFNNLSYKEENMNISLFGESNFVSNLSSEIVLYNEMVPEIDNGYCEYGGYVEKTSYLLYKGIKIVKPILINREIEFFYNNSKFLKYTDNLTKNMSNVYKLNYVLFNEYNDYIRNLFDKNMNFSFIFGSYAKKKSKYIF